MSKNGNGGFYSNNQASVTENSVLAKEKRGFPVKRTVFILLIALVVISLILLVINLVINSYFKKVTVFDGAWEVDMDKVNSKPIYQDNKAFFMKNEEYHEAYDQALLNYAQANSDMRTDENVFNYAVYGIDQFGDSDNASADIIMLVSVNKIDDHVTFLAFETRMLVYIPTVGVGTLSDAYWLGGPQFLTNTIEQNYGLHIDGFIDLDMTAFVELIDEFGTIEFSANKEFLTKLNEDIASFNESKKLTGEDAVPKAVLKKDKVYLTGMQTLAYLRKAGAQKSSVANSILKQLITMAISHGFGGVKTTLDIALDEMTVSLSRNDVGALITIGLSVLRSIETVPVGNMEGRAEIKGVGITCDYEAERAAVISAIYLD